MLVFVIITIIVVIMVILLLFLLSRFPLSEDTPDPPSSDQGESGYSEPEYFIEEFGITEAVEPEPIAEEFSITEPIAIEAAEVEPADICIQPQRKYRSKGERATCLALEEIYNKPFITVRPEWLTNPETRRRMELDCYNEELGIAAEYNGKQHYVWPNYLIKSEEDFLKQAQRDRLKVRLCDQRGVYLITIPYTVPLSQIKGHILQRLSICIADAS